MNAVFIIFVVLLFMPFIMAYVIRRVRKAKVWRERLWLFVNRFQIASIYILFFYSLGLLIVIVAFNINVQDYIK